MLRPDFLFSSRALWEKRAGTGISRAEYEAPVPLPCRAEIRRGCEAVKGKIFLPADCGAGPGDRITVDGGKYLLGAVESVRDLNGRESHIEGELL